MNKIQELGFQLADKITNFIGSWSFILIQTVVVLIWVVLNITVCINHFDPYPFILLNLFFSTEAAYATPLILMASKRQSEKDGEKVDRDLAVDHETNTVVKDIQDALEKLNEDLLLDRQAIKDHIQIKQDVEHIKKELDRLIEKEFKD